MGLDDLQREDLETRVQWLRTPSVRDGVSINFWPDLPSTIAWYEARDVSTRRDFVLRDAGGTTLAMCGVTNVQARTGELYLYVSPALLGRGLGTLALRHLLIAVEVDVTEISLQVRQDNIAARKIYEREGFLYTSPPLGCVDGQKLHMIRTTAPAVAL